MISKDVSSKTTSSKAGAKKGFKKQKLNILTSNICGFKSKTGSLNNILSQKDIDIACLSETHCEGDTVPSLKGFSTYFRNRQGKSKGGIAMLIRNELEPWVMKMESGSGENEYFACKFTCFDPEVVVVLQYGVIENRYTTNEIMSIQNEIFSTIKNYCDESCDIIWTGDLNVHLGRQGNLIGNNPTQSWGGKNLYRFIQEQNLYLANEIDPSHTHWDRSGGSSNILDLVITNSKEKVEKFEVDTHCKFTPFRVRKVKSKLQRKFTDHVSLLTTFSVTAKANLKDTKITSWNYFKERGDERFKTEMDHLAQVLEDEVRDPHLSIEEIHQRLLRRIKDIKFKVYGKTTVTQKQAKTLSEYAIWKKRMKEVEESVLNLKKVKVTDRIWEIRSNVSQKFKDKQFVAVTDPETGRLTQSREETFDVILNYNYNLLRKDQTVRKPGVEDRERVKERVTASALQCDTLPEDEEFQWSELSEIIEKLRLDNKAVYRDLLPRSASFILQQMLQR